MIYLLKFSNFPHDELPVETILWSIQMTWKKPIIAVLTADSLEAENTIFQAIEHYDYLG